MAKFGKVAQLAVKDGATAKMQLYMLNPTPTLIMRPADETNKGYLNDSLKNSKERVRLQQRTGITPGIIKANRERDRELYAKHVVIGWENVQDDDGIEVPFDQTVCREYLDALPDWIFDEVREFAQAPSNFIALPDPDTLGN